MKIIPEATDTNREDARAFLTALEGKDFTTLKQLSDAVTACKLHRPEFVVSFEGNTLVLEYYNAYRE